MGTIFPERQRRFAADHRSAVGCEDHRAAAPSSAAGFACVQPWRAYFVRRNHQLTSAHFTPGLRAGIAEWAGRSSGLWRTGTQRARTDVRLRRGAHRAGRTRARAGSTARDAAVLLYPEKKIGEKR